ncbi:hypothetical protein Ddc_12253 [Ditylenchus destructor]|nr:hypothetical protein Ddc_12253 [Ditylenchus destructor]
MQTEHTSLIMERNKLLKRQQALDKRQKVDLKELAESCTSPVRLMEKMDAFIIEYDRYTESIESRLEKIDRKMNYTRKQQKARQEKINSLRRYLKECEESAMTSFLCNESTDSIILDKALAPVKQNSNPNPKKVSRIMLIFLPILLPISIIANIATAITKLYKRFYIRVIRPPFYITWYILSFIPFFDKRRFSRLL